LGYFTHTDGANSLASPYDHTAVLDFGNPNTRSTRILDSGRSCRGSPEILASRQDLAPPALMGVFCSSYIQYRRTTMRFFLQIPSGALRD
jgi:hypothetical protein